MQTPIGEIVSASVQDYLKTIYSQTRSGQPTSTAALAEALEIRPASVTNMLKKLAENQPDLLVYRKRGGVSLTPEGEQAALRIIRRHRLIEQFLYQILDYPLDRIHQEAEELEHVVSPYFIERITQMLDDPAYDPHGHPIPDSNFVLNDTRNLTLLSALQPGQAGNVRQITDQNPELLVYLRAIGIFPGARIEIRQANPIDGTLQIQVQDVNETNVLGEAISKCIQVELTG